MKIFSKKGFEIEIRKDFINTENFPKGFVITDKNILDNYKELIGEKGFVIDPGEKSKSPENYLEIIKKLENAQTIIAFGGGVVGDLSGFVASTYKRGTKLIQIPTSLLAMIDSSIGGKNGVNLGNKKNYLGTIYQPEKILVDTNFLKTLPNEQFKQGIAEMIKYSILFREPPLERFKKKVKPEDLDLINLIYQCCLIKTKIIEQDELDKGPRHVLNFGHTIGHALELLKGFNHGEAISIGMVKEYELGLLLGIIEDNKLEELKSALRINNLSTNFPDEIDAQKFLEILKKDKKGELIFAFNEDNYKIKVSEEDLKKVLPR